MSTGFCPFGPEDRVAYAFGELPAERRQAFGDHLADCRTCRLEVEELEEAASLCQTLRTAKLPEPRFEQDSAPVPTRPWWRRPLLVWTPVAAAAAAAVLLFIFLNPAPPASGPGPKPVLDYPAATPLLVQVVAVEGPAVLQRASDGRELELAEATQLRPGDVLTTPALASVQLGLDDGSQLLLNPGSSLALTATGQSGDHFGLARGSLGCQVTPRGPDRPFLVATHEAEVRVVGTRFVVQRSDAQGLQVGVDTGAVEVTPAAGQAEPTVLRAGQQGRVAVASDRVMVGALEPALKAALGPSASDQATPPKGSDPAGTEKPPVKLAKLQPRTEPDRAPKPAPLEPDGHPDRPAAEDPRPDAVDKSQPKTQAPESLEALVARLYEDTGWIFDQFQADMKAGRYSDVLRKLDNYLSDPDSPMRDEAAFLKAVCQEKLGRKAEALRTYRSYLNSWPQGPRARDSRASIRRLWSEK